MIISERIEEMLMSNSYEDFSLAIAYLTNDYTIQEIYNYIKEEYTDYDYIIVGEEIVRDRGLEGLLHRIFSETCNLNAKCKVMTGEAGMKIFEEHLKNDL
jgi:hypothetical protein